MVVWDVVVVDGVVVVVVVLSSSHWSALSKNTPLVMELSLSSDWQEFFDQ